VVFDEFLTVGTPIAGYDSTFGEMIGGLGPKSFSRVKYVTFRDNPVTYSPNPTGLAVRE
jgi:hypothetical protein